MNLNLIYFSPTGSTKKVVETLASSWNMPKINIDISISDDDYSTYSFPSDDLCIIGVPSFGGRVPSIAIDHLKKMNSNNTPTIIVVTYGNRAYDDTILELQDTASEYGFRIVAAISAVTEHSIIHKFTIDRPNNEDLDEIISFGEKIKEVLSSNAISGIIVPGNRPYKEYGGVPLKPKTNKNCHKCGLCASLCPSKSISHDNPSITDDSTCISCMRCISICPNHARYLNKVMLFIASQKMKKVCSTYKKNQLFL